MYRLLSANLLRNPAAAVGTGENECPDRGRIRQTYMTLFGRYSKQRKYIICKRGDSIERLNLIIPSQLAVAHP